MGQLACLYPEERGTPRRFSHYILGDERSHSLLCRSSSNDLKRVFVILALVNLDAKHLVDCFLEQIMRVIQERVVAKMDSLIGHVSDHDIALRDRMKCQAEKRLGRNSDRSSSQVCLEPPASC